MVLLRYQLAQRPLGNSLTFAMGCQRFLLLHNDRMAISLWEFSDGGDERSRVEET